MSTPLVVTHPCALVRDGLHQIFSKSQFRPVQILPALNEEAETYLKSAGICIWLIGVREPGPATNEMVRRVVAANPHVRAVILAASHAVEHIVPALESGACGFLCQDIPSNQLIKSLELIVLGQTVTHPQFHLMALAHTADAALEPGDFGLRTEPPGNGSYPPNGSYAANGSGAANGNYPPNGSYTPNGRSSALQYADARPPAFAQGAPGAGQLRPSNEGAVGDVSRNLSRREMSILRTLTEGASNKIIARKLVITESTVKVHMKAILRKLRLQNRTQAAIWARTHLQDLAA